MELHKHNQNNLHDKDFYAWTKNQSKLLKNKDFEKMDIENLIEEIEALGRSERHSLYSHTVRFLLHLLKKKYQPNGQGNSNSWNSTIFHAKKEIQWIIKNNPSLKNNIKQIFLESYRDARKGASIETGLEEIIFPEECPWTIEELFKEDK